MNSIHLFDGHCDTISRGWERGEGFWDNEGQVSLKRTRKFGRYAQFFAIFCDTDEILMPPWEIFHKEHYFFQKECEKNSKHIVLCRTERDAERAFCAGKTAAFLSVEGAELLDCDLAKLEEAYRCGVRAVNLTWNHANALSGSNAEQPERGLSEQGRGFVRRMEELGMLVDVSHLSDPGFWDVAAILNKPFFASHSNARTIFSVPRSLTDGQFTAIIEHNGVAGLNLFRDFLGERANVDTIIAHLEHFLALGGEKNIAIGGDWDGVSALPEGISGVWDMDRLYERLLQKNYHETLVHGVFFQNLMRVVSEVCTM